MKGEIPYDVLKLYVKMWQENVGVTEPMTPLEIKYNIGPDEVREPPEFVLQTMLSYGLAEEHRLVVRSEDTATKDMRLIRAYQIKPNSLEKLL